MMKWRMPLKCDFTTGWSADRLPLVQTSFQKKIAANVIEHHYTKHKYYTQSTIWCRLVPIPHPDTVSLEKQWMVCVSLDAPQIGFTSVSFEWGEEKGNAEEEDVSVKVFHWGESVDPRLSLIWMRQRSNKTKEKKKGDPGNYGLSVATDTTLMQFQISYFGSCFFKALIRGDINWAFKTLIWVKPPGPCLA